MKQKVLIGQIFDRLKIIGYAGKGIWVAQCLCGSKATKGLSIKVLANDRPLSCGCLGYCLLRNRILVFEDKSHAKIGY